MADPQLKLAAPAKLNLFLHIIGRRQDGYHELQTVFQFLDFGDWLHFHSAPENQFELIDHGSNVAKQDNLIWKALQQLQRAYLKKDISNLPGVTIELKKYLPQGAGLGGGSSDAATTLVGLNYLWGQKLSNEELQAIGLELGADVPVFIHGSTCFAEGIGEQFTDVSPDTPWYLIVKPNVHISTAELFNHPDLKRDSNSLAPASWELSQHENVFEPVVCALHPEVAKLRDALLEYAPTRLTGSGACLFSTFESRQAAEEAQKHVPRELFSFIAQGQNRSPLFQTLTQ